MQLKHKHPCQGGWFRILGNNLIGIAHIVVSLGINLLGIVHIVLIHIIVGTVSFCVRRWLGCNVFIEVLFGDGDLPEEALIPLYKSIVGRFIEITTRSRDQFFVEDFYRTSYFANFVQDADMLPLV